MRAVVVWVELPSPPLLGSLHPCVVKLSHISHTLKFSQFSLGYIHACTHTHSYTAMCACVSVYMYIRSDQISRSVVSDSLQPHESQHARPPRRTPTPGVHPDSCPSSQRWHPAISSSVIPFSSCPQSLPASESFPMSQLFT